MARAFGLLTAAGSQRRTVENCAVSSQQKRPLSTCAIATSDANGRGSWSATMRVTEVVVQQRLIFQKRLACGDRITEVSDLFAALMPCLLEPW